MEHELEYRANMSELVDGVWVPCGPAYVCIHCGEVFDVPVGQPGD